MVRSGKMVGEWLGVERWLGDDWEWKDGWGIVGSGKMVGEWLGVGRW
jgi:hypothetical protein